MKYKTLGRLGGFAEVAAFGFIDKILYDYLPQSFYKDQMLAGYLLEPNEPLENKVIIGGTLVVSSIATTLAISAGVITMPFIVDGLVDIVKGTHHNFLMHSIKKFSKDPERKKYWEKAINDQLDIFNNE